MSFSFQKYIKNILNIEDDKNHSISENYENSTKIPTKFKKSLNINTIEENKVKINNLNKDFNVQLKVYGKSLFQNLILTVIAYSFKEKENIPIKCTWKRVKNETKIHIKGITSNSYIPTAADIGYTIEVEITAADHQSYGHTASYANYGPVLIDTDIRNTLDILLSAGGSKFSCYLYDTFEQEKAKDKEILLHIFSDELKVVEMNYEGKEHLLEKVKYHQENPIITLHPYDSYRFSLTFYKYSLIRNELNGNERTEKVSLEKEEKIEYNLIAMSKQCRELIYLLINSFIIDEKLKNTKIFNSINFNVLPNELKIGIIDLITEIKTLREENLVMIGNLKYLQNENGNLNNELKSLEEDFQLTLESINSHVYGNFTGGAIFNENNNFGANNKNETKTNNVNNLYGTNFDDKESIKTKLDELKDLNLQLKAKNTALKEENSELVLNYEILKNKNVELVNEHKNFNKTFEQNDSIIIKYKQDIDNFKNLVKEQENILNKLKEENLKLKEMLKETENKKENKENENFEKIEQIQKKLKEIETENEKIKHENKSLINQRNLLLTQKDVLAKEIEKMKGEQNKIDSIKEEYIEEITNLKEIIKDKDNVNLSVNNMNEDLKLEFKDLKNKHELMMIEYNTLKMNYDEILMNPPQSYNNDNDNVDGIFVSSDEYNEYLQLKKESDETEAIILQLKSNSMAKDLEIEKLRKELKEMKEIKN